MTSKFSYGLVDSLSVREMKIEQYISGWFEVYCEEVGRVVNTKPAYIKDVFLDLIQENKADDFIYSQSYREFSSGSAILFVKTAGGSYLLETKQPRNVGSSGNNSYLEVFLYGTHQIWTPKTSERLALRLKDNIRKPNEEVTWMYNDGGHIDEVVFPLKKYGNIIPDVYPFIPNIDKWIDRFVASDSNILILNGPMGTGKSSLIAHIIKRGNFSTMTAFDDKVMKNDGLYTNFISWSQNLLVLEDADLLLLGRLDKDNDTMSKLLNVSEGIIDTRGKKIVFTANIPNTKDIDSALLRPGRCFDVVEFRELTLQEANIVREKLGKPLFERNRTYSLAQVYQL